MSRKRDYEEQDDRLTRQYEEDALFKDKNKEEFRVWQDYVLQYNHDNNDNPDMQIAYEVRWKDDNYKVKLLNQQLQALKRSRLS